MSEAKVIHPNWSAYADNQKHAKVSLGGEAFWVIVEEFDAETRLATGIVDELDCSDVHGLSRGDRISFMVTDYNL
jgi:hypothetical protein